MISAWTDLPSVETKVADAPCLALGEKIAADAPYLALGEKIAADVSCLALGEVNEEVGVHCSAAPAFLAGAPEDVRLHSGRGRQVEVFS